MPVAEMRTVEAPTLRSALDDQVELELAAALGKRQVAGLVEDEEIDPGEAIGDAALPSELGFRLELVHQINDIEVARLGAAADAAPRDADGQMALARPGAADQHHIALVREEATAGQIPHQLGIDRRALEDELLDLLGRQQLGNAQLIADRAGIRIRRALFPKWPLCSSREAR